MSAVVTSIDIKALLKLALPLGSRLLTGYPATPVSWISHFRTRPPFFADIAHSEMLLVSTTMLESSQSMLSLETVIEKLAQSKASALGIQGTITPRIQHCAQTHNFPLITLPDRAILPQVEQTVQRLLTNRESQLAYRISELEQALQRHATNRRGLTTMLNTLARMLNCPVMLHDRQGTLFSRGLPVSYGTEESSHLGATGGAELVRNFHRNNGKVNQNATGITAPLLHKDHLLGYVSVLNSGDAPDDFDLLALEHSVAFLTREVICQQNLDLGPEHLTQTWITDWLTHPAADDELLTLRAEKDDFQATYWYAVVVFQWNASATEPAGGVFASERMARLIKAELRQRHIQAPVGLHENRCVVFFPLDEPQQTQRLQQMCTLFQALLTKAASGGVFTVGVGRPAIGLTALRDSYEEAERILSLPGPLWGEKPVASFSDLSLYDLLLNVGDLQKLTHFCERWLMPLMRYDEQHHTELLSTLNTYFENNGNVARTAHMLNIHRNTLVYRMSRMTEILLVDMDDANVRLNLHLALKIFPVLNT